MNYKKHPWGRTINKHPLGRTINKHTWGRTINVFILIRKWNENTKK